MARQMPKLEKMIVASATELFLMEAVSRFEAINFPAIMLEHIYKTMTVKDGIMAWVMTTY